MLPEAVLAKAANVETLLPVDAIDRGRKEGGPKIDPRD